MRQNQVCCKCSVENQINVMVHDDVVQFPVDVEYSQEIPFVDLVDSGKKMEKLAAQPNNMKSILFAILPSINRLSSRLYLVINSFYLSVRRMAGTIGLAIFKIPSLFNNTSSGAEQIFFSRTRG